MSVETVACSICAHGSVPLEDTTQCYTCAAYACTEICLEFWHHATEEDEVGPDDVGQYFCEMCWEEITAPE